MDRVHEEGELFNVSDEAYTFFHNLEMVCVYLKDIFLAGGKLINQRKRS